MVTAEWRRSQMRAKVSEGRCHGESIPPAARMTKDKERDRACGRVKKAWPHKRLAAWAVRRGTRLTAERAQKRSGNMSPKLAMSTQRFVDHIPPAFRLEPSGQFKRVLLAPKGRHNRRHRGGCGYFTVNRTEELRTIDFPTVRFFLF